MSFLGGLKHFTDNIGRGAEDLFTLGGTELARKFGGRGARNVLDPMSTALGANFEAGAAGGGSILGAQGLGAFGAPGGASAMTPYMPTSAPNMGMAGSTLGGGMNSPLNLGASGASGATGATAAGPSAISTALQAMRGMSSMGGGPQSPQGSPQDALAYLYKLFPSLRPGAELGQHSPMGGPYGAR